MAAFCEKVPSVQSNKKYLFELRLFCDYTELAGNIAQSETPLFMEKWAHNQTGGEHLSQSNARAELMKVERKKNKGKKQELKKNNRNPIIP